MRGKVGSQVELTIVRQGTAEPFVVKLERAVIKVRSVRSRMVGKDVGYIRITSFNEQVQDGLEKAVKDREERSDRQGRQERPERYHPRSA
jgi:carboxyl-terminal processing protease